MVSKTIIGAACAYLMYIPFSAYAGIVTFTDNFDDPGFTNSHWIDGNPSLPQTWSFVNLNGADLGYHATVDVPPPSTQEPAARIANNGTEYYTSDLYIEIYALISSHEFSDSTKNKTSLGFGIDESAYTAFFELNYEQTIPTFDLNLIIYRPGLPDQLLANTPVAIEFDTFYKLVVQTDSEQAITVSLYDLNNSLLGSIDSPNVLNLDQGGVGIDCRYDCTFNDFYLSGTTVVPIPGAIWLFGSGLIGLVGLARRKKS